MNIVESLQQAEPEYDPTVLYSASDSDNDSDSNNGNSDSTYSFSSTVDDSLSESDVSVDVPLVCSNTLAGYHSRKTKPLLIVLSMKPM